MPTLFDEKTCGYAQVALERGVDRYPDGLTYAVPANLAGVRPGERVLVPLGRNDRPTAGYVIDVKPTTALSPDAIKPILQRDRSTGPAGLSVCLPDQLLQLARWMSSYYCTPIGMTLSTMLPAAVKRNVGAVLRTYVDLPETDDGTDPLRISPQQQRVLQILRTMPLDKRPVEIRALAQLAGLASPAPVRRLLDRNLLEPSHRSSVEATWAEHASGAQEKPTLTDRQSTIVQQLSALLDAGFSAHLLFGVTGSGKTEVYFRLIEQVVLSGRVALLLVPEISLTPQTGGRLIGRFPDRRVAVLHSGLTAAQRHQQWALSADGTADIVIGARSAVFAPVPDERLGIIVVDEEHDASYNQDQSPRYQGRDVAVRRGQLAGCPVLLGSATPSMESWHNAAVRSSYQLHRLPERVPGSRLPRVHIVDFVKEQQAQRDKSNQLVGPILRHAIQTTLDDDGQVLVLLNRRGYANYIACTDRHCGWLMTCDDCDVTTVYHLDRKIITGGYVQCHHCRTEQRLPTSCPECGRRITTFGLGTQRVEEELERTFPLLHRGTTMLRLDSDSMRSGRDLHTALGRFGRGEVRMLVGTQMIAKGLDYPNVRLVGVINADTAIHLPDFRASERTFQLVSQVSGRCGRGQAPGAVIVQTFNPDAPAITLAASHDFEKFAAQELAHREQCQLPPSTRMARIILRDTDEARCRQMAETVAQQLRAMAARPDAGEHLEIRGPAPCPLARLAGRHRHHVELFAPTTSGIQWLLTNARNANVVRSDAAMAVDVDPTMML
jgi:primosomal protein N' (replication factor Y)